jgi:RND family efflux transporter MFP subunit
MEAAEKGYYTISDSIELSKGEGLEKTKEQLNTSLKLAQLGVDSAKLALSYYDVTAPISGKIISKAVDVNGFATSSQPAYIIANDETMTVTFHVSESVKNTLTAGAELIVERNGKEFKGAVTEVGNAVNQQTGLFQIKGTVYANGEQLPSGVSVKIFAETYKAEQAIIIQYDAVYYENEGAYVYLMKDGKAVKTYVETGIFDDEDIEITSGIVKGDMVITSWSPRLIDGADVETTTAR